MTIIDHDGLFYEGPLAEYDEAIAQDLCRRWSVLTFCPWLV